MKGVSKCDDVADKSLGVEVTTATSFMSENRPFFRYVVGMKPNMKKSALQMHIMPENKSV